MKSILLIGLGDFGHHLCRHLWRMKNEILAMDKDETALEDLEEMTSSRLVADCTQKSALQQVGVSNFDICFVCIGKDFKSNLIIVSYLKELGAKLVVSQTDDEVLGKFLINNGADEVIHPNKDSAMRAAVRYSSEYIFDYNYLKAGYSIYEMTPLAEWVSKSILESHIREKFDTYIIGINHAGGQTDIMPRPDTVIRGDDRLLVLAHEKTMEKLLKKIES